MILSDPELSAQWRDEVTEMRHRIRKMRLVFVATLMEVGLAGAYDFIARQKGMFSFLGLPVNAVKRMRSDFGVYAVDSSRVCVAAMNESNMRWICDAVKAVSAP
jgi:aromatic-amino-acid transaminase